MIALALLGSMGCESQTRCSRELDGCHEVDLGRYLAVEPELPITGALFFFHGYGGSASSYADADWIVEGSRERGLLLVLPDGQDHSWSFVGSPEQGRDEQAFLAEVRADVLARWPEAAARMWVGGFSIGGSLTWDMACYAGDSYDVFLPISGAFWDPLPESCPAGPVNLRHSHGLADETVPMEGRPIGDARQGDVYAGWEVWKASNGCADEPDGEAVVGLETCQIWSTCSSGQNLSLCLHDGGHRVPEDWFTHAMDWADAAP